jgi:hypothetical protein
MAVLTLTATGANCPKTGGIKAIYLSPASHIESITAGSSHDITNIVFDTSGIGFGAIEFKRGEAELTESSENTNEVVINIALPNPNAAQRKQLNDIKKVCEMQAVVELYDDQRLLYVGWDVEAEFEAFLKYQSHEFTSGRAKSDANLFQLNLMAEHSEPLRVLSGISGATVPATTKAAIIAELLAATSV